MRCLTILLVTLVSQHAYCQPTDKPVKEHWASLAIPDAWRKVPSGDLAPIDGYSWYRAQVKPPAAWQNAKLTLVVEALDDARATYINGINIGATGTFPPQFRSGLGEKGHYKIPVDLLKAGEFNSIAIRVYQNDPRPNFSVAAPVLLNESAMQAIRLNGQWHYHPGDNLTWANASAIDHGIDTDGDIPEAELRKLGGYSKVDSVDDVQKYVSKRKGDNDPLTPQEAAANFEVPDDLEIKLVLSEPDIAQPLFMTWDVRGRMWVMEYRQYPEVAGVKMVSRDVYLRSVYDKVPEPPPHGAKGRDRISIHEDIDGDGVYESHKTFVDGLNIATSVAIGNDGVYVTNPPYLLFYPDRNHDDIPDGDPEVLLEGFGLEDSHSVINSLRFGPDGWLYCAQGSTVSANVKRPGSSEKPIRTMGQQIWRYHPKQKRFEVFAEGGGNTFGVEIDARGNVYSGHNGGDTRGFHYVQGGYYRKGFTKHGPLSNPYAFGFFANMKHPKVARFTHNFIIYEDGDLPEEYNGRLFGIEPLQGQVVMSDFRRYQSSFETEDISRVVKTADQWFRPVDIKAGPDGGIYIADMYEQRIDHSSHYAGRIDRSSGRIYRLHRKTKPRSIASEHHRLDLSSLPTDQLIPMLGNSSRSTRQTLQAIFRDRNDATARPKLLKQVQENTDQIALESLWALNSSGHFSDDVAVKLLQHKDQFVRGWTVRLLCDSYRVSPKVSAALTNLAFDEPYIYVRKQLASSAKRLPTKDALPILRNLINYDEDADDIHQPLLIWWALESKANGDGRNAILKTILAEDTSWTKRLVQEHLLARLIKRYALSASREELLAAAHLFEASPDGASNRILLQGFEDAYKGRSLAEIPEQLVKAIGATGEGSLALRLRQGTKPAVDEAIAAVKNTKLSPQNRRQYVQIFGELRRPEFIPVLLDVATNESHATVVSAALTSLQSFDDLRIGQVIVEHFQGLPEESRPVAETLLASRSAWAIILLRAVESKDLQPEDISETGLRKILLHDNTRIKSLIAKHWGKVAGASTQQMKSEVDRVATLLVAGSGNPKKGKPLFMKNCGKCHILFEEGGQIGPDLTTFKRDDLSRILTNVINPSLEIREGFENHVVVTTDGRVVTGFLADKDSQVVLLRGTDGQNIILRHETIDEMIKSKVSIMPEGTLKDLSDQQIRDLFAYLRSSQPVNY